MQHVDAMPSRGVRRRARGSRIGSPRGVNDLLVALRDLLPLGVGRRQRGSANVFRGLAVDELFGPAHRVLRRMKDGE